jgi:Mg2+/Co2+ transporter CorB
MTHQTGFVIAALCLLAILVLVATGLAGKMIARAVLAVRRPLETLLRWAEQWAQAVPAAMEGAAVSPARDQAIEDAAVRQRIERMLRLRDLEVSDIMIHRTNMWSVNAAEPPEALVRSILQSAYTRVPVWRGTIDNIVGILHAKDLLRALDEVQNDFSRIDILKVAEKPWFVPDTTPLHDQLNAFLRRKAHLAIVVDEYGEVEGLVTLEDIVEEIVGEIRDERNIELPGIRQEADGSVVVEGSVSIRDLNRALDWNLPDEEATTVAGLVIHESQSIPDERQAFTFHGKRFIVMKRDRNRIARLRIRPVEATAS